MSFLSSLYLKYINKINYFVNLTKNSSSEMTTQLLCAHETQIHPFIQFPTRQTPNSSTPHPPFHQTATHLRSGSPWRPPGGTGRPRPPTSSSSPALVHHHSRPRFSVGRRVRSSPTPGRHWRRDAARAVTPTTERTSDWAEEASRGVGGRRGR